MLQIKKKNIIERIRKPVLALFAAVVIFQPLKVTAAEVTMCHQHEDECYKTGAVYCTDEVKVTTHAQEFYCTTCGRIAAAHVVVETYSCKHSYSERELRRIAYCYTCHSIVQNEEKGGQPNHYRNGQINICGIGTDTVITRVSFFNTDTAWTKENTVLKVNVTEPATGLSLAPYTYAFSGGTVHEDSCTVSENGVYSVTVTGNNGQSVTTSVEVSNIDKGLPEIGNFYVDKEYPQYESAMLIVEATDGESGLAEKAYSFDGGLSYSSSNTFSITSNGTYTVHVRDKAGNIENGTVTVTCFEKKPVPTAGTQGENSSTSNVESIAGTTVKKPSSGSNVTASKVQKGSNSTLQNILVEESTEDEQKEMLKQKLENSDFKVREEDIPGIHSSVMRSNAEKNAVPTTLNLGNVVHKTAYAENMQTEENLVKNISLNEEKEKADGSFAQVSKAVVGAGVLICIGMVGFLLVFLVKNSRK